MSAGKTLENTELFINSGWNVIPYESITYDENNKKIAYPPIKWSKFLSERNTKISPAGALICGEQLVIDCDDETSALEVVRLLGFNTLEDIKSPEFLNKCGFIVKTFRGYHFYFEGDNDIEDWKGYKIDIQATNKKLIYLPTKTSARKWIVNACLIDDHTKQVKKIKLTPLGKRLKEYLLSLKTSEQELKSYQEIRYTQGTPLARVELGSILFWKRLTPKKFRSIPEFRKVIDSKGYLLPTDIKEGFYNDYLIAIAGILTTDSTIDINKFWEIIKFLHQQFKSPPPFEEIENRVKGYPENKYPKIPFVYDSDWDKQRYSFVDSDGKEVTILYDLDSSKFLIVMENDMWLKNGTEASSLYANRMGNVLGQHKLASIIPSTKLISDPDLPFGINSETKLFNTFKKSKYIELLNDESKYTQKEIDKSKHSKALKFLEHLFKDQYEYFLRFLKTKLTTFKYSPVSFFLYDEYGGAGKGVLQSYLNKLCGDDRVSAIPFETFKSKFTSDFENKLFVFCNEYPDDYKLRKFVTDKLKDLTGSSFVKIEKKGKDPYSVKNIITYMVTSNRMSVEVKQGDRRFCVINCDKKFNRVFGEGFFDSLMSDNDMINFIIYLKHCVEPLDESFYMEANESHSKELFIDIQESILDKVVNCFVRADWNKLKELVGEDVLLKTSDVILLENLAGKINIPTQTLIKALRKREEIDMVIKYDASKKYSRDNQSYAKLPSGSLKHLI